jgi:hypothetical protein
LSHRQLLLSVDPFGLLAVHHEALLAQQHMETPVAEPSAFARELAQPVPEVGVIRTPTAVADR